VSMRAIDLVGGTGIVPPVECLELLQTEEVGRVGFVYDGQVEILPVNYRLEDDLICFASNSGRKLAAVLEGSVTFEVDNFDRKGRAGWSVVVHGTLADASPCGLDDDTPSRAWTGPKDYWVRIRPMEMSGRRVQPGFWERP
jgi:uncharacterized protein